MNTPGKRGHHTGRCHPVDWVPSTDASLSHPTRSHTTKTHTYTEMNAVQTCVCAQGRAVCGYECETRTFCHAQCRLSWLDVTRAEATQLIHFDVIRVTFRVVRRIFCRSRVCTQHCGDDKHRNEAHSRETWGARRRRESSTGFRPNRVRTILRGRQHRFELWTCVGVHHG